MSRGRQFAPVKRRVAAVLISTLVFVVMSFLLAVVPDDPRPSLLDWVPEALVRGFLIFGAGFFGVMAFLYARVLARDVGLVLSDTGVAAPIATPWGFTAGWEEIADVRVWRSSKALGLVTSSIVVTIGTRKRYINAWLLDGIEEPWAENLLRIIQARGA